MLILIMRMKVPMGYDKDSDDHSDDDQVLKVLNQHFNSAAN